MAILRSPRVLVVDDEKFVRSMLCDALDLWGFATDPAGNVSEGLRLFDQGGYDLVLTDFMMPGGDGLQLIEAIRRRDASVPIIMFTAAAVDLERLGHTLGFALMRKPLQLGELEAAVRGTLAARGPDPYAGR